MVKLNVVKTWNADLVQSQPLVTVFFGTGGIGHYAFRELAVAEAKSGKGLRAYLVGRNSKVGEEIIIEAQTLFPKGQFKFVQAEDLSLIKDVNRACQEIIRLEEMETQNPRIDILMLSHAGSIFLPRKDTKEGLDITMSLMYYSRMKIIINLLPLLLRSTLPANVVSIYAAGTEDKLFPDDLSLRNLKIYSYSQARSHMNYMHTFFMESLAEQNRGKLRLTHIFPGIVIGPGYYNPEFPLWFKIIFRILKPIIGNRVTIPPTECGERMLSLSSPHYPPRPIKGSKGEEGAATGMDGTPGSGSYMLNWDGESLDKSKFYNKLNKDEIKKLIWDHTMKAFQVIEGGSVFAE